MLRTDHFVIPIRDPVASLTFYQEVLGLPLVDAIEGDDWGGHAWLMLIFALEDGRELVLTAFEGAGPGPDGDLAPDSRHYAFAVDSRAEQDSWRARLAKAATPVSEEDHGAQHSIYFTDPNGVVLEITTPPSCPPPAADAEAAERARRWAATHRPA
ncbi:MAG: VOC family protein [Caulobacteraceae bacterium]|nr:VOC family protein [Caulobacteraceae bacterium]